MEGAGEVQARRRERWKEGERDEERWGSGRELGKFRLEGGRDGGEEAREVSED